jgi:hypothetical protein
LELERIGGMMEVSTHVTIVGAGIAYIFDWPLYSFLKNSTYILVYRTFRQMEIRNKS